MSTLDVQTTMLLITYTITGFAASLIVVGWQGYKDTPWENFVLKKFLRSITVGILLGIVFFVLNLYWNVRADNLGILLLTILSIERIIGETYKGFIRKTSHPEYERLLIKLRIVIKNPYIRSIAGIISAIVLSVIVIGISMKIIEFITKLNNFYITGVVAGFIGGTLNAIGGALKDSQFEGFKFLKFIRSPIVGIIGGLILVNFSSKPFFLILAITGFERVVVELYKTFVRRQVRGIFANQKPKYKIWFKRRWVFIILYGIGVAFLITFLTISI